MAVMKWTQKLLEGLQVPSKFLPSRLSFSSCTSAKPSIPHPLIPPVVTPTAALSSPARATVPSSNTSVALTPANNTTIKCFPSIQQAHSGHSSANVGQQTPSGAPNNKRKRAIILSALGLSGGALWYVLQPPSSAVSGSGARHEQKSLLSSAAGSGTGAKSGGDGGSNGGNKGTMGGIPKELVDQHLRLFERTTYVKSGGTDKDGAKGMVLADQPVFRFDINAVASNSPIEDFHSEHQVDKSLIFGIFDGHGGTECSRVVSEYLGDYVADSLSTIPPPSKLSYGTTRKQQVVEALKSAFTRLDRDLLAGGFDVVGTQVIPAEVDGKKSSNQNSLFSSPAAAAAAALSSINLTEPITIESQIRSAFRPALAGSCAIVAYFEAPDDLYIACTGDSRAVLGRQLGDGSFEAVQLSEDQTIRNVHEYDRMIGEHPGEQDTVFIRGRVLGSLMPTRAFGDSRYKWPVDVQRSLLPALGSKRGLPKNYLTPPYVTAEPEVTHYKLSPPTNNLPTTTKDDKGRDRFLILASDGLYDALSSEECVELVAKYMEKQKMLGNTVNRPQKGQVDFFSTTAVKGEDGKKKKNWSFEDENAATHLIRNALGGADEERVGKLLAIPPPYSRRYRDDMTVAVIFLGDVDVKSGDGKGEEELLKKADPGRATPKMDRLGGWMRYLSTHPAGVAEGEPKAKL
ncbi:hypothetical protein HK102_002959 [Quaeritorhiza haematococci]|nr:hypothetical protein HK102_002959 [Quaeritorhiza haematococci]